MKRSNWLKNTIGAILIVPLFAALAGCGGGNTGVSGAGGTGGGGAANIVSLNWTIPDANIDGSTLDDLAGYKVYYGTSTGEYTTFVDVGNSMSIDVMDLTPGVTYHFTVTAYDTSGNESTYSDEVVISL